MTALPRAGEVPPFPRGGPVPVPGDVGARNSGASRRCRWGQRQALGRGGRWCSRYGIRCRSPGWWRYEVNPAGCRALAPKTREPARRRARSVRRATPRSGDLPLGTFSGGSASAWGPTYRSVRPAHGAGEFNPRGRAWRVGCWPTLWPRSVKASSGLGSWTQVHLEPRAESPRMSGRWRFPGSLRMRGRSRAECMRARTEVPPTLRELH